MQTARCGHHQRITIEVELRAVRRDVHLQGDAGLLRLHLSRLDFGRRLRSSRRWIIAASKPHRPKDEHCVHDWTLHG